MGFWIFMFLMVLVIPLTMLGFGRLFMTRAPKDINYVFGYRTKRSMKSRETWEFAHRYIGKLWSVIGAVMLPLSVISMLFVLGKGIDAAGTLGGIIMMVQILPLVGAIFPTERALKENFDESGRPF